MDWDDALLEDYTALCRECVFKEHKSFAKDDEWLISLLSAVLVDVCHQHTLLLERPISPFYIRILATGTFHQEIGERSGISQTTVSQRMTHCRRMHITHTTKHYISKYGNVITLHFQIQKCFCTLPITPVFREVLMPFWVMNRRYTINNHSTIASWPSYYALCWLYYNALFQDAFKVLLFSMAILFGRHYDVLPRTWEALCNVECIVKFRCRANEARAHDLLCF